MRILTIIGTPHYGNTRAITDLFLNEFKDEKNEFDEIVLPNDFHEICYGCAKFFFKVFGMTQKNGWNKTDFNYWKNKGWLEGKKPY